MLYKLFLEREKLVYSTFNKMKIEVGQNVMGFCWIPARSLSTVNTVMQDLKESNP